MSDRVSILISLYNLAMSSQAAGELTGASGFLKEGLSVAAEAGDETSVVYYLESVAAVARQQDNSRRAVRLLAAAAAMLQARGSGWLHAYVPRTTTAFSPSCGLALAIPPSRTHGRGVVLSAAGTPWTTHWRRDNGSSRPGSGFRVPGEVPPCQRTASTKPKGPTTVSSDQAFELSLPGSRAKRRVLHVPDDLVLSLRPLGRPATAGRR
jgi:hypothetical protein